MIERISNGARGKGGGAAIIIAE
uniref:Uncharacterized protein n=1 Tax=Anguilla anguilla TaxID=7936 RepID=A0A0E9RZU8_ANGAN